MLHILWILIKFILIILGILLGLALLAVALILFCPVRYQARAVKEGVSFKEVEVEAKVTWLFHAVGAGFSFCNGERKLVFTLFGISLETIKGWLERLKGSRKKGKHKKDKNRKDKEQKGRNQKISSTVAKKQEKTVKQEKVEKIPVKKEASTDMPQERKKLLVQEKKVETERAPKEKPYNEILSIEQPQSETVESETFQESSDQEKLTGKQSLFSRMMEILNKIIRLPGKLWNRILSFLKNIVQKLKDIKRTVSGLTDKLGWWRNFLSDERTKAAVSLVWKDAKELVRHVLPTKVEGQVTFGCEDPSITGAALAVLGMTFPFHKSCVQVTPLFDGENRLTGNISLKGRVYGIMFVKAAIEIYINKNIKYVINRWKHKED